MKQTAGTFPAIPSDEVVASNLDEQIRKRAIIDGISSWWVNLHGHCLRCSLAVYQQH